MARAFYSFYFDDDAFRVSQVRNMGVVEGDQVINDQSWEQIKRGGDDAIKRWIAAQMKLCGVVIVLVGENTATRHWVDYEIRYAWDNYKPLFGVRINKLKDVRDGTSGAGANPFANVGMSGGGHLSDRVPLQTPNGATSRDIYADIKAKMPGWIQSAPSRSR